MILLRLLALLFCLQRELAIAIDMVVKLYCGNVPHEGDKSPTKMQKLIEKAMEQMRKEHYLAFYKHLLVCNPSLGIEFLQEI
jgi:hypothetical protein